MQHCLGKTVKICASNSNSFGHVLMHITFSSNFKTHVLRLKGDRKSKLDMWLKQKGTHGDTF